MHYVKHTRYRDVWKWFLWAPHINTAESKLLFLCTSKIFLNWSCFLNKAYCNRFKHTLSIHNMLDVEMLLRVLLLSNSDTCSHCYCLLQELHINTLVDLISTFLFIRITQKKLVPDSWYISSKRIWYADMKIMQLFIFFGTVLRKNYSVCIWPKM